MSPPAQRPHRSEQLVETPADFLEAVTDRFGHLEFDLACSEENKKAEHGFNFPDINALTTTWSACSTNLCWLNPPYEDIESWVKKCSVESTAFTSGRILLLVPASVGSEWFRKYVHGHAYVLALSPRLKFVGHTSSYPKDLMLCIYGGKVPGFNCWRWKP